MTKKNVVSIEDRIPKLKQARKKKANRRLVFYLSIFFLLLSVIVYLQSPLSHVKQIEIKGNSFVTEKEVNERSGITEKTNIWTINKKKIAKQLTEHPAIASVKVKRSLPRTVEISLKEQKVVGYIREDNEYYPILENAQILKDYGQKVVKGDAPLLINFTEDKYLQLMTEQLKQLPNGILNLISEVHWAPSKENKNKVSLYMNDGFMVAGTIRNFAKKMDVYPSIVSQLDPNKKGIIHIGVGAYFEEFK